MPRWVIDHEEINDIKLRMELLVFFKKTNF